MLNIIARRVMGENIPSGSTPSSIFWTRTHWNRPFVQQTPHSGGLERIHHIWICECRSSSSIHNHQPSQTYYWHDNPWICITFSLWSMHLLSGVPSPTCYCTWENGLKRINITWGGTTNRLPATSGIWHPIPICPKKHDTVDVTREEKPHLSYLELRKYLKDNNQTVV